MLSAWAAAEAGRFRSILLLRRHEKHRVFQIARMASVLNRKFECRSRTGSAKRLRPGRIKKVYDKIRSAPPALEARFSLVTFF